MKSKSVSIVLVGLAVSLAGWSFADEAPVVEANSANITTLASNAVGQPTSVANAAEPGVQPANIHTVMSAPADTSASGGGSDAVRLSRLEQQVANITNMNLPQQLANMQQQVQKMSGQLQVQQHDLKMLSDQQRSFYQDVDQRIEQVKNLISNGSDAGDATTPANNSKKAVKKSSNLSLDAKDASAYKSAFRLVSSKQYRTAIQAFQQYINTYPNGQYVANAHYWMGELFLKTKQSAKALAQFDTVVTDFSSSNKVADARLKAAIVRLGQGQVAKARSEFSAIKKAYPGSTAAQLASIQLQQMDG